MRCKEARPGPRSQGGKEAGASQGVKGVKESRSQGVKESRSQGVKESRSQGVKSALQHYERPSPIFTR